MRLLTKRQKEILAYLREQVEQQGVPPSTREIQTHFGFASQTAALNHLRALQRKGFIERQPNKARALRVISHETRLPDLIRIPLLGQIAAGMPAGAEEEIGGTVSIAAEMLKGQRGQELFALRVVGDSMVDAHIVEGDVVVLEKRAAQSGEIVAALVDGESTLKRLIIENGEPLLKAENARYPRIVPEGELKVQGVMVALLRKTLPGAS